MRIDRTDAALWFSPPARGRESPAHEFLSRGRNLYSRVRCPLCAWADLIGGRSADRRRILTRRAHVVSVFAERENMIGERRGVWTLISGSLLRGFVSFRNAT